MTTVLIVEDYGRLSALYEQVLAGEPTIHCIGRAATGEEALKLSRTLEPDIWLVDISLPDGSGLNVARALRRTQPETRLVVMGEEDSEEYRGAAAASGADAYLLKERTAEQLVPLIRRLVAKGTSTR